MLSKVELDEDMDDSLTCRGWPPQIGEIHLILFLKHELKLMCNGCILSYQVCLSYLIISACLISLLIYGCGLVSSYIRDSMRI